jgi:hypothetical protein
MPPIIEKSTYRRKVSAKRTHSVIIFVKYKDLMELRNFLENSNDRWFVYNNI